MTPIERALSILGPLVDKPKAARCPQPDHEDKHKSATFYPDGFHCHACDKGGSPLDYYALVNKLSIRDALVKLGALGGTPSKPRVIPEDIKTFAREFATKLANHPRELAASQHIIDLAKKRRWKSKSIDEALTDALSHPSFTKACRNKGLNPLLVHDLIFMEVA